VFIYIGIKLSLFETSLQYCTISLPNGTPNLPEHSEHWLLF